MAQANQIIEHVEQPVPAPASETAQILSIIERAVSNPAFDPDKMMKLFELRERIEAAAAKRAFDEALAAMQPKLPQVDRKGRIVVLSKADRDAGRMDAKPQQSTPYALWEDINTAIGPLLAEHGFALSFRTGTSPEGKITVTGVLSHREGHREETTITLAHDSTGSKNSVQAVGSSISYGKRYTAGLLLNITSRAPGEADDDGRAAGALATISDEQREQLQSRIIEVGADPVALLTFLKSRLGIDRFEDIPAGKFQEVVEVVELKRKARK